MANPNVARQLDLRSIELEDRHVIAAFQSPEEWLTRRQIADRVWRKVTPDFIARIERLVGERQLVKGRQTLKNGLEKFTYRLEKSS